MLSDCQTGDARRATPYIRKVANAEITNEKINSGEEEFELDVLFSPGETQFKTQHGLKEEVGIFCSQ